MKNIYVILYVDDLIIVTKEIKRMNEFKEYLKSKFHMTDLKNVNLFLGIHITRENNILTLDQSAYIKNIINKFGMNDCKTSDTPMECNVDYHSLNSDEKYDAPCQQLLGSLLYIMLCTRLDISTVVNIISRFARKNNKTVWLYLKRILRYLKGTIDLKLTYSKNKSDEILVGYADSDWGGDLIGRKSTSGFLFKMYNDCTICWTTRKPGHSRRLVHFRGIYCFV